MASGKLSADIPSVSEAVGGGGSNSRILVPVDAFDVSGNALELATSMCVAGGGVLRVAHVRLFHPPVRTTGRFYVESSLEATEVLDRAVGRAWASGARASGVVIEAERSKVGQAITSAAAEWRADLIVIARTPRHAISRLVIGSVTDQVLRHAPCPVVVVRPALQPARS